LLSWDQEEALNQLKKAVLADFDSQLNTWAENIHLFPPKWARPLLIEEAVNTSLVKPELLIKFKKIYEKQIEISKIARSRGTAEQSDLSDSALNNFRDSYMQDLLK
jgi:hypothetical protein